MKEIRFGIIGLGLMGKEFASAAARWFHLTEIDVKPVIVAVCDTNKEAITWFEANLPSISFTTTNYKELLAQDDIDAIYCAVPHNLHEQIYIDIIKAGKHLIAEKPFGIDKKANDNINKIIAKHPEVVVRCSSEFPFFPGAYEIIKAIENNEFGQIIEVEAGLLHSSDMNPDKAINWKRIIKFNGEYGCMGDLGMHVLHIPLRFGWQPTDIKAQLSNIIKTRPDGKGSTAKCETWDNATILARVEQKDYSFPITLHTKRIAPGNTNNWFIKVHGLKRSMEFSTKEPKTLKVLNYKKGQRQAWQNIELGYESAYKTITGGIFEFGFSDAMLQMFAAFCDELEHPQNMLQNFHCVTPEEASKSHDIFTTALKTNNA